MHNSDSVNKPGERAFSVLMLVGSLLLLWQAYDISKFSALSSPGAFPMAASAIMVISSTVVLVKQFKLPAPHTHFHLFFYQIIPPLIAIMIGLIFVFAVMLEDVGFIISAFVFLLITIQLLYRCKPHTTLLLSVLALVVIYVVFRLVFQVVLPEGIVPEREIMAWLKNMFSGGQ